ncbi:hypothetical protein BDW74DRAFT_30093 [Aspergillus multicolor]|uniref:BTB/POZ domain-containing protein n=1 Tax=Aspergillus multicolor TaxID=41759 RepID=UPI003CCE0485
MTQTTRTHSIPSFAVHLYRNTQPSSRHFSSSHLSRTHNLECHWPIVMSTIQEDADRQLETTIQEDADRQLEIQSHDETDIKAQEDLALWTGGSITLRRKELAHNLTKFLHEPDNADFCDLIINCRGKEFPCHRAIVCAQSPVIRDIVRDKSDRKRFCRVKIKCHPLVARIMIQYLYTCDYQFCLGYGFPSRFTAAGQTVSADPIDRLDCCELALHLQVHNMARSLLIRGLVYLSAAKVNEVLKRTSFPTVFPRFVREVYTTIRKKDALMKRIVTYHADKVVRQVRGQNHFDQRFPFFILQEIEEFRIDFLSWRRNWDDPLNGDFSPNFLAPTHWYC